MSSPQQKGKRSKMQGNSIDEERDQRERGRVREIGRGREKGRERPMKTKEKETSQEKGMRRKKRNVILFSAFHFSDFFLAFFFLPPHSFILFLILLPMTSCILLKLFTVRVFFLCFFVLFGHLNFLSFDETHDP